MNQEFKMSPKLKKWRKWMETIHDEIRGLLRDTSMFWEIQAIIIENPRTQWPSVFSRYLGRIYLSYALSGLRRQMKPHKDSISFVGLLDEIAKNPEELSSNYYCSHRSESEAPQQLDRVGLDYQQVIKAEFEQYADASGEHVYPQMVKDDLDKLKKAAKACEDFADKRIVHQDNRDPKGDPTFDQLDNCIKLLDQTYVKYHLLFYAEGMNTLMPTRQFGSAKGLIIMGEDFDDELRDFKEYM